ncbi:hypothetical protein C3K47_11830 [Solitalea longa]|uniref:Transcriptional regulator MntR n=1 Tax=Solitalea longa TaxID=2079460 RepID=A0A2S5A2B4_9SPHI|nr:metal-dependent transcriptional regulator [Solitalea longa]POY36427.1 hypothetical protein C3K47_11830 [Solitalea longa]
MVSTTEENYLKTIQLLSNKAEVNSFLSIAKELKVFPSSVTSMTKKLESKGWVIYESGRSVKLTNQGEIEALKIIRKHRLIELFLMEVLKMGWAEVHEIAEQMEHIKSELFFNQLDKLLGHPRFDPHGEAIPDVNGKIKLRNTIPLSALKVGNKATFVAVTDESSDFLRFLDKINLSINSNIEVLQIESYDGSVTFKSDKIKGLTISSKVAERLLTISK